MLTASDLNRRLTILEPFQSQDADGHIPQRFVDRGMVWANIQHRPGSEAFQQARMESRNPATIAVRASDLTRRMTAEWEVETTRDRFKIAGDPNLSQDRAFVIFQVEGRRK